MKPCTLCTIPTTRFCQAPSSGGMRLYHHCSGCDLIFLEPEHRLSQDAEKAEYELHENDALDPAYQDWLGQFFVPFLEKLAITHGRGAMGLDFGSGPTPVLAERLRKEGHEVQIYDPFFAPNFPCLDHTYDFIVATEVVEHFCDPKSEFERLNRLLRPGGLLGVMTELVQNWPGFPNWHYRREMSHVSFYSEDTMKYLSHRFGLSLEVVGPRVCVFQKSAAKAAPDAPPKISPSSF